MINYVRTYLNVKLGQRGAEMVEYAIVLACICAVGIMFYATKGAGASGGLNDVLTTLWDKIAEDGGKIAPKSN